MPPSTLPDYAEVLLTRHRAFESELRDIVDDILLEDTESILDVACGDGLFSRYLAEALPDCEVVGLDASPEYLELAHEQIEPSEARSRIRLVEGDAFDMSFEDDSFDLVWCAQSMITLQPPRDVLLEMSRVVRPGGTVVILENDEMHSLLLPWPAEVELVVQSSLHRALADENKSPDRVCFGRRGVTALSNADLLTFRKRTYPIDMTWPFSDGQLGFLRGYLGRLWGRVEHFVTDESREETRAYLDPECNADFLESKNFEATWFDIVFEAVSK